MTLRKWITFASAAALIAGAQAKPADAAADEGH